MSLKKVLLWTLLPLFAIIVVVSTVFGIKEAYGQPLTTESSSSTEQTDLQESYANLEIEFDNLKKVYNYTVENMTRVISNIDLPYTLEELTEMIKNQENGFSRLETAVSSYQNEVSAMESELADCEEEIETANATLTQYLGDVEEAESSLQKAKQDLATETDTTRINSLNDAINHYSTVITNKRNEISNLNNQISTLNTQKETLTTQLNEKETEVVTLTEEIEVMRVNINELNTTIYELNVQLNESNTTLSSTEFLDNFSSFTHVKKVKDLGYVILGSSASNNGHIYEIINSDNSIETFTLDADSSTNYFSGNLISPVVSFVGSDYIFIDYDCNQSSGTFSVLNKETNTYVINNEIQYHIFESYNEGVHDDVDFNIVTYPDKYISSNSGLSLMNSNDRYVYLSNRYDYCMADGYLKYDLCSVGNFIKVDCLTGDVTYVNAGQYLTYDKDSGEYVVAGNSLIDTTNSENSFLFFDSSFMSSRNWLQGLIEIDDKYIVTDGMANVYSIDKTDFSVDMIYQPSSDNLTNKTSQTNIRLMGVLDGNLYLYQKNQSTNKYEQVIVNLTTKEQSGLGANSLAHAVQLGNQPNYQTRNGVTTISSYGTFSGYIESGAKLETLSSYNGRKIFDFEKYNYYLKTNSDDVIETGDIPLTADSILIDAGETEKQTVYILYEIKAD